MLMLNLNISSNSIYDRRSKRIETRKKSNYRVNHTDIWSDNDSNFESNEDTYQNFFKIKNIFEKKEIDNISIEPIFDSEEQDLNIDTANLTENNPELEKEFISKKTKRPEISQIINENDPMPEFFGPKPIKVEFDIKDERKFYAGTGLKRDEAELFSHYVQQGKRIPRRGEVGLSSDEIEKYEKLGYVMSGSRHRKMNLARLIKEKLVYTAEEKRALAIYKSEEQQRRERNIVNEMKYMWQNKQDDDCENEQNK